MGRLSKPIVFVVLLALGTLTEVDLIQQNDHLRKQIPIDGPAENPWKRRFVDKCFVFNMTTWNKRLNHIPVSRISESA